MKFNDEWYKGGEIVDSTEKKNDKNTPKQKW